MNTHDYRKDFSLKPGHVWLNAASEGPLPKAAVKALQEAVEWKNAPHLLTVAKFQQVPRDLKKTIARLIHVDWQDVILGNSATYGMHLLANGLKLKPTDEIILLQNDFPSDILPWLSLQQKGVIVHQLLAQNQVLTPEEITAAINPRTKLVCLPFIHSFSGFKEDLAAIGKLCRLQGILLIVNLSQAAGALTIDLSQWEVDAVVCAGYKWLLGPYGTGFCWIRPQVRGQLDYPQNYWISLMDEASLFRGGPLELRDDHSARRYDVFATANFFNYVPWRASIEYLLSIGLENVCKHNQILVDKVIQGLNPKRFDLLDACTPKQERSNIVVISHKDPSHNARLFEYLKGKGFYLALWKGKLRISPHIYNTIQDMEALLSALNSYEAK